MLLIIKLRQYARTLGLDVVPVPIAGNLEIGAFEIQTGIQLSDLPEMVNGHWSSWESCSVGLHHVESDFAMDL